MSIVAIKGMGALIGNLCKSGQNVVRRHKRGGEPCDDSDVFEWLGSFKTKASANKFIKSCKMSDNLEIIEYKSSINT